MWSNLIADITPLAGLSGLRSLELSDNRITAIPPLPGLTIGRLNFVHNEITDISGLAGMTSLLELLLDENQITDLTPLAGLTNLVLLSLDENQVVDLTPLAGLTSLTRLRVAANNVTDLTPLAGLEFADLTLSNNPITDLAPLIASMCPYAGPPGVIVRLDGLPGEPFCNDPNVAALAACRVFLLYDGGC